MTTLASVSLLLEQQNHKAHMSAPLTISLGLGLATYSPWHHDCDTQCSLRSQNLVHRLLGDSQPLATSPQHAQL